MLSHTPGGLRFTVLDRQSGGDLTSVSAVFQNIKINDYPTIRKKFTL
jgi:hypothetical protein